jgi:dephospho-CoA kinase
VAVPFVGLTGGLGAGKSTALAALERLGAAVLSTDAVVHELYRSPTVRTKIRERWGDSAFDGQHVDRAAIARLIFSAPDQRGWLEALLWPLVGDRVEVFRDEVLSRLPRPIAGVVETPLLFEAGVEARFDATIAVIASDQLRAERIAARDQQELAAREARQFSQDEKASRASYVVVNDGTIADLDEALRAILVELAAK